MKQEQIIRFFDTYKKGTYTKIVKETTKNGFTKRTKMVCRFVNYYNIGVVKAKGATPRPLREWEETIIPHVLKINHNTNNTLPEIEVPDSLIKDAAQNSDVAIITPITEEAYYLGIGEKKRDYAPTPLFSFKADEVVALGAY